MFRLPHGPKRSIASAVFALAPAFPALSDGLGADQHCQAAPKGAHERYHLAPAKTSAAAISFATDWSNVPTGGWLGIQAVDDCRVQVDGTMTWHGKTAVRVEVQPGDDPLALHANSERAELLIMQDVKGRALNETAGAGTQYYATSYLFPPTWRGQQLPWSGFDRNCAAGDQQECNSWSFVWQFYGWGGLMAAQTAPDGPEQYQFNGIPFARDELISAGKWTDFIFMVDWKTGSFKVWRRDEGEQRFVLVLTAETPVPRGREIYVKQGLYRGGQVSGRTDVLWIGPTARGSSMDAVASQAFGTAATIDPN